MLVPPPSFDILQPSLIQVDFSVFMYDKMAAGSLSHEDGLKKKLKSKTQQRSRRRRCLFKKAKEYSTKCDADVFLILRIRKNGQIFFLNSNATGQWPPSPEQLVSLVTL